MSFSLACTTLTGTNKAGILKPDAAGYWTMCIGALDIPNSRGDIYVSSHARHLFEDSKLLMRRGQNGYLRGEYGHPRKLPGMSAKEYIQRNHVIDETLVSHYFKEVWLDESNVTPNSGGNIIIPIMALLKPTGPYGEVLAKQLESDENVAFSIRCFCDDVPNRQGTLDRRIKNIITWDYVNEPGLAPANKYNAPALEAYSDDLVNEKVSGKLITTIMNEVRANPVAVESETVDRLEATLKAFGQGEISVNDLNHAFRNQPKSFKW